MDAASSLLKQQCDQQAAKLAACSKEIGGLKASLQNEIRKRKDQERIVGLLNIELSERDNQRIAIQNQLQQEQQELRQTQQQLQEAKDELQRTLAQLQRLQTENQGHEDFIQQLSHQVDESESALHNAQQEICQLKAKLKEEQDGRGPLMQQVQKLCHALNATEAWGIPRFWEDSATVALPGQAPPLPAPPAQHVQQADFIPISHQAWPPVQEAALLLASTAAPAAAAALPAPEPAAPGASNAGFQVLVKKELTPSGEAGSWPPAQQPFVAPTAATAGASESGEIRSLGKHQDTNYGSKRRSRSPSRSRSRSRSRGRRNRKTRSRSSSSDSSSRNQRHKDKKKSKRHKKKRSKSHGCGRSRSWSRSRSRSRGRGRSRSLDQQGRRGRSNSREWYNDSKGRSLGTYAEADGYRANCITDSSRDAAPRVEQQLHTQIQTLQPPPPPPPPYTTDGPDYVAAGHQLPSRYADKLRDDKHHQQGHAGGHTNYTHNGNGWQKPTSAHMKSEPGNSTDGSTSDTGPPAFEIEPGTEGFEVYNEINFKPIAKRKRKKPGKGNPQARWGGKGGKGAS